MQQSRTFFLIFSFLFLSITLSAQTPAIVQYDAWWKKIDSLVQEKGLYKTALGEVEKLYKKARTEKAAAQQVRALVYRLELREQIDANSDTLAIHELEKESRSAQGATASLLHALRADYYNRYYQAHRWELYDRSTTTAYRKENIRTWSAADFHQAISAAYRQSVSNDVVLQSTPVQRYDAVLRKGNSRVLRPTLFDLLAWKAINYFQEEPTDIARPAAGFLMNSRELFAPAAEFAAKAEATNDTLSYHYQALQLYRQLLAFHLKDKNPEALLDADLHRLSFVNANAVLPGRKQLYIESLDRLEKQYPGTVGADQAAFQMAEIFASIEPVDYVKAVEICERVTAVKKDSEGYINCYNLLQTIIRPSIGLTLEKVNLPGSPFRSLVTWKNTDKIFFRLIKASPDFRKKVVEQRGISDSLKWQTILASPYIRNWEQTLPAAADYREHRTEIKVDALPSGEYFLVGSTDKDFMAGKSFLAAQFFHVSTISYANRGNDYFVLHRNSGQPLEKARVQVWNVQYDYQSRRNERFRSNQYNTDANGHFRHVVEQRRPHILLEISHGRDTLFLEDAEYRIVYAPPVKGDVVREHSAEEKARVFFFTDRSIYRPGQVLHFKGIALIMDEQAGRSSIYPARSSVVYLYNANGEKADSLVVKTNEYGSYTGQFTLPATGLTGAFRLEDPALNGMHVVNVEEYKRPRFFVEYKPVEGSYRVNDTVTVKGFAKAYAGNILQRAKVNYRVSRIARFPYPWKIAIWPPRTWAPREIVHGSMSTGDDGGFSISFPALPDEEVDRAADPVFDYQVTVDVTDLNGETRTATTIVPVSYKALQVKIATGQQMLSIDSLKYIPVFTQNMSGQYEKASLKVELAPLLSPGRLVRKRYWEQPDKFVMTEKEFLDVFPQDEYVAEHEPRNWKKGEPVWQKVLESTPRGNIAFEHRPVATGWYQVSASAVDRYGDTVRDEATIFLYDIKVKTLPFPSYLLSIVEREKLEPGQSTRVYTASSAEDLFMVQQRENVEKKEGFSIIRSGNNIHAQTISASEADRGGIGIHQFFVKHNRLYQVQNTIEVPWTNKELDINVSTYREKTLPGSEEKWSVTISGKKGEKLATELLTGLYDASLDQFQPHQWQLPFAWPRYTAMDNWKGGANFSAVTADQHFPEVPFLEQKPRNYDQLISFGDEMLWESRRQKRTLAAAVADRVPGLQVQEAKVANDDVARKDEAYAGPVLENADAGSNAARVRTAGGGATRKDFRETAFFFPQLRSDANGNFSFSFRMPEALTTWKWQLLAHSSELAMGQLQKEIITQKELMVQPNMPRFLREGDRIELSTKLVNLSEKELTGQVELQLIDATTNQPVDGWFHNFFPNQYFTVAAGGTELVKFPIEVPYQFDKALTWRLIARAGEYSDGEEAFLPVMSNRQLVTEALPFSITGSGTKNLELPKLLQSSSSETLSNRSLTVEFTTNPAWLVIQALPYLQSYPYDCSEQLFNKLYANLLSAQIVSRFPRVKTIMEQWQVKDTSALLSNLQKNQELKQVLLEETPWVMEATSEAQQKQRLAELFNLVKQAEERETLLARLLEMQTPNGGFSWFKGGPDDRFITQYILTGIGRLKHAGALPKDVQAFNTILNRALPYLDARLREDYEKRDKKSTSPVYLNYYAVQYHYMRSFLPEKGIGGETIAAANHYRKEMQQHWIKGNRMAKGMIALALHRTGDKYTAQQVLRSLEESSINDEQLGMYWKQHTGRYYWQDAPIETQALLVEAFTETGAPGKLIAAMKTWLIRNKQTNRWESTKATADACYALLLNAGNWLDAEPKLSVQLGDVTTVKATQAEAGTGYYRKIIPGTGVHPEMGKIKVQVEQPVTNGSDLPVWGAVYWQYFENLDKITPASSPLRLRKQVMREKLTSSGPVLEPVTEGMQLQPGDKLKVRLELTTDRAMEYVHLKDMRASALEPVNVLSGYKWQGRLGYYESTRDASTNFFISYLPTGSHVLEYALFVTHSGVFSNGISSAQCMYAPEFTSHTEGIKISVE